MHTVKKEVYDKAIGVLGKCANKNGIYAAYPGYDAVWSRDSMITSLGGSLNDDKQYKNSFRQSLILLGKYQSEKGQIPNAVDIFSRRNKHVDYGSIDSSLWWVLGHFVYNERYGGSLLKESMPKIKKAMVWLDYQDFSEKGILQQLPTTDWQDAFPHRYGTTINTQALYYKVLKLMGEDSKARKLKDVVNNSKDEGLWNKEYYLSYRWKNHNKYKEKGEWFDSLGNLLAILFDLADENKAQKILKYIEKNKINKPYPIKAMWPAIRKGSKYWEDYFSDCDARDAYSYLNGGIWTYIGGFYILALLKYNKKNVGYELERLAKANNKGMFSEWIHGRTGEISGEDSQAWNAGMYVLAYESVLRNKVLI